MGGEGLDENLQARVVLLARVVDGVNGQGGDGLLHEANERPFGPRRFAEKRRQEPEARAPGERVDDGGAVVDDGEECDLGDNNSNSGQCTLACLFPKCGDGFKQAGEECDDANADNTDSCLDTCKLAKCGDGFVGPSEQCDDGNSVNTDACTNVCKNAFCGDSIIGPGETPGPTTFNVDDADLGFLGLDAQGTFTATTAGVHRIIVGDSFGQGTYQLTVERA